MTEEQADTIIRLLESIDHRLSNKVLDLTTRRDGLFNVKEKAPQGCLN